MERAQYGQSSRAKGVDSQNYEEKTIYQGDLLSENAPKVVMA